MAKGTKKTAAEIEKLRTDLATILAKEQADKAAALARGVTEKAAGLTRETEQAATELAERRGREAALVESRLNGHDTHSKLIDGSIDRTAKSLEKLTISMVTLTAELRERNKHMTDDAAEAIKLINSRVEGVEKAVVSTQAEKRGIVNLQNKQIALVASLAAAGYLLVSSGIHP
jgi:hypothetical protein